MLQMDRAKQKSYFFKIRCIYMTGYIEEGKSMGKAVIFDLDGTLLNTLDDLEDSVNHTLNYFKYPKRTKAEVRSFIGGGAKALIKKSFTTISPFAETTPIE